jgi:cold-inducible RNA-binding protein
MNLYVGNLPYRMTEDQVQRTFEQFGRVSSCTIIKDKATFQSKGFGFIEMPDDSEASGAIAGLNGKEVQRRKLLVQDARRKGD